MDNLGIYFGPQLISIVETKANKILHYVLVPQTTLSPGEVPEERMPPAMRLVALLKDELKKNNIATNEAIVSISGKDLIVRTFEMPILPRQELNTAVSFEAKKYIPFKIEDLISDFQYKIDKSIQKTRVLFVGIKKEALDNYISIFSQLDVKVKAIEYSAFSVLRLLKLTNVKEKGIIAVVNIDLTKDDEANFVVLEDEFPLFSRDISLLSGFDEPVNSEENQQSAILERLKREIQISLDYYDRKFPSKNISKIFFITNSNFQKELTGFVKELGLGISFIDVSKYIEKPIPFSLAFIKGYSSSLSKINIAVKIDLLAAKERVTKKAGAAVPKQLALVLRFKYDLITVGICILIYIMAIASGAYRKFPLENELRNVISTRPQTSIVPGELTYSELMEISSSYKRKIEIMEGIIKKRLYLTPLLDAIPRLLPKGMRFVEVSYKADEGKRELILKGTVYAADATKELEEVKGFLAALKGNQTFSGSFKEISVVSTENKQIANNTMTYFVISCQDSKKTEGAK